MLLVRPRKLLPRNSITVEEPEIRPQTSACRGQSVNLMKLCALQSHSSKTFSTVRLFLQLRGNKYRLSGLSYSLSLLEIIHIIYHHRQLTDPDQHDVFVTVTPTTSQGGMVAKPFEHLPAESLGDTRQFTNIFQIHGARSGVKKRTN
ncbi:uncharacterized protein LAJ45_08646 [Morchella importuna]|uniref:uncharacterized protein n=1 Tax=Morchella importuna TaxID=1174673 RepID=UPI001E8CAEBC|nr:uncharacterized protein LAJ45_08646 [Morchella importuna]KAH8147168.1 hypothetical protein LAJ45_08646 [Morchella importuna]